MTVNANLARRADFHIEGARIGKTEFLTGLTAELRAPGTALDALLVPHLRQGPLPIERTAVNLARNPELNRPGASPLP
jgi:hypothetical protein